MQDINTISQIALNIEKMGIVGILAVLAIVFIYLYIKQAKDNQHLLSDIAKNVTETLENQRALSKQLLEKQEKLIDLMINREKCFREG